MPIRASRSSGLLLAALAALAVTSTSSATAAPRKEQLKSQQTELRERLATKRRALAASEEQRAQAADRLRETELAISATNRSLHQLGAKRATVQEQIRELDAQQQRLDQQTVTQQAQLARLLYLNYTGGDHASLDAFGQVLKGQNPNQATLDLQYMTYLSQAKADLIADLRSKKDEKKKLASAAREKSDELAAIEQKQQQIHGQLVEQQQQRQQLLNNAATQIKAQRQEIGALEQDEKRLAKLIASLKRTSPPAPPKKPPIATRDKNEKPPKPETERIPDSGPTTGAFAMLRGKLALPVRGQIAARFGERRAEGGTTWKGLFIRAGAGGEVRAVAPGEVVFADWLRGFGNLLVIDHGEAYLSVYGNNESLLKEPGQRVTAGETVATVGNTGGNPESGLYFELRFRGQAFDPLRWIRLH